MVVRFTNQMQSGYPLSPEGVLFCKDVVDFLGLKIDAAQASECDHEKIWELGTIYLSDPACYKWTCKKCNQIGWGNEDEYKAATQASEGVCEHEAENAKWRDAVKEWLDWSGKFYLNANHPIGYSAGADAAMLGMVRILTKHGLKVEK